MVFFVLSGFLVGGAVHRAIAAGEWSWTRYAVARLTRLWIVLLPALLLTCALDALGSHLPGSEFYRGAWFDLSHSGPRPSDVGDIYAFRTLLANAVFLQCVVTPPYGSDGPLWSLSYEFWYYVIFPLAYLSTLRSRSPTSRIVCGAGALALCLALPLDIVRHGLVWLFGFGAALLHERLPPPRAATPPPTIAAALLFLAACVAARLSAIEPFAGDLLCGATFAALLYRLAGVGAFWRVPGAARAADFSYTLYLTHFPPAALLAALFIGPTRLAPGALPLLLFCLLTATLVAYAYLVYLPFERNTERLRRALLREPARPDGSQRAERELSL